MVVEAVAEPARRPRAWTFALAVLGGTALGIGAALWAIEAGARPTGYQGWEASKLAGSPDADALTRARVARSGLLALDRSQAIYFNRTTDSAGRPLDEGCRYRVSGGPLPARWWSVTVYAADHYLPRNDGAALSFDATEVVPDAAGRWQALVGPAPRPGMAFASTQGAGDFALTLRLYNPDAAAQRDFAGIALPVVERLDCGGERAA